MAFGSCQFSRRIKETDVNYIYIQIITVASVVRRSQGRTDKGTDGLGKLSVSKKH